MSMQYNIVCGIDNNYVEPLATMLNSLFLNNREKVFCIHVLCINVSQTNKDVLQSWVKRFQNEILFYDIDNSSLKDCPIRKNDTISIATYLRLLIPETLPQSIDKVLYLDVDIMICSDIEPLYAKKISDKALAAVEDAPNNSVIRKPGHIYFNAGIMLLNLSYFREKKITAKAFSFIRENKEKLLFHDQDVLNAILNESFYVLDPEWNLQDDSFRDHYKKNKSINIIHFSGKIKPWHKGCFHPYKKKYKQCIPHINLSPKTNPNEALTHLPRYQRFLFLAHMPDCFIFITDTIISKLWNLVFREK